MNNFSKVQLRKAAILLVSLADETASKILMNLDRQTVKKISEEIRQLGEIKQEDRNKAVGDFLTEMIGQDHKKSATVIRRWSNSQIEINFPRFLPDSE
ncbi:hypothetical protein ACFL54_01860 [Planctomycetota bacterium]